MAFSTSIYENRCLFGPFTIANDTNLKTKRAGVRRYNSLVGFVLNKLGFADRLSRSNGQTIYVNRNSLREWLSRHGSSYDCKNLENAITKICSDYFESVKKTDPSSSVTASGDVFAGTKQAAAASLEMLRKEIKNLPPLHAAVIAGDVAKVRSLAAKSDTKLTTLWTKGNDTALHLAVKTGDEEMVRILSQCKGIDERNKNGLTPISLAVELEKTAIIKILMENKADVTIEDSSYENPTADSRDNALAKAIKSKNPEIIEIFAASEHRDKPCDWEKNTMLHLAVLEGNVEAVKLCSNMELKPIFKF